LSGEIGIDPMTVMYEISVAEAELIIHGYRQRQMDAWARTQRIAYVVAQTSSKKKISPSSIVDLSPFEDTIFDEAVFNKEEEDNVAGDIREHMSTMLEHYKQLVKFDDNRHNG